MSEYLDIVEKARNSLMKLQSKQIKQIRDVYRSVAKDLDKKIAKANSNSLTKRVLLDYQNPYRMRLRLLMTN